MRVLVEPLDADLGEALSHAAAMEEVLIRARISVPQVHHGEGLASWAVSAWALGRGHDMRTASPRGVQTLLPNRQPASEEAL